MSRRAFFLGAIAYALVTFPFAYVWHLVAFDELYSRLGAFGRPEPIITLGFFTIVFQGFLLSWLFPRVRLGGGWARRGLSFGIITGAFLWSSQVIASAAKHPIEPISTWIGIETLYFLIQFSLVGIAMGWVHRDAAD